jgi:PTH2 family peptidyl-tRNA hydrolase
MTGDAGRPKYSKQVIVLRNDLNMRKGKMIAQGAHASLAAFMEADPEDVALLDWLDGASTKIAVSVPSEEALLDVYERARTAALPCALVTDAGRTEFGGIPTRTAVAIGPAWSDAVDAITGELKLL